MSYPPTINCYFDICNTLCSVLLLGVCHHFQT